MPVKKRPAAWEPTRQPAYAQLGQRPAEMPPWARHFCQVLASDFETMAAKANAGEVPITLWSDCAGMATEALALADIAAACAEGFGFSLRCKLYGACDNNAAAEAFILAHHRPVTFARDLFERDFESGTYHCSIQNKKVPLPTTGIDLYTAGFPCTPWSPRGRRLGFDHTQAGHAFACVRTIRHMQPCVFILENVVAVQHSSASDMGASEGKEEVSDFGEINRFLLENLPGYAVCTVSGLSPLHCGFPTHRTRLFVVGVRGDQASKGHLEATLGQVMATPAPLRCNWRSLLALNTGVNWQRLHELPTPGEQDFILASGCTCTADPLRRCPRHPCKCPKCSQTAQAQECVWRLKAMDWIHKHYGPQWLQGSIAERLTYCRVAEMQGRATPSSARERSLLNLLAHMEVLRPIAATQGILDLSQAIDRCSLRTDGSIPTVATNTRLWSLSDAEELSLGSVAYLHGHDLAALRGLPESPAQLRCLLGNGLHRACVGMLEAAAFAAIFRASGAASTS